MSHYVLTWGFGDGGTSGVSPFFENAKALADIQPPTVM